MFLHNCTKTGHVSLVNQPGGILVTISCHSWASSWVSSAGGSGLSPGSSDLSPGWIDRPWKYRASWEGLPLLFMIPSPMQLCMARSEVLEFGEKYAPLHERPTP